MSWSKESIIIQSSSVDERLGVCYFMDLCNSITHFSRRCARISSLKFISAVVMRTFARGYEDPVSGSTLGNSDLWDKGKKVYFTIMLKSCQHNKLYLVQETCNRDNRFSLYPIIVIVIVIVVIIIIIIIIIIWLRSRRLQIFSR